MRIMQESVSYRRSLAEGKELLRRMNQITTLALLQPGMLDKKLNLEADVAAENDWERIHGQRL